MNEEFDENSIDIQDQKMGFRNFQNYPYVLINKIMRYKFSCLVTLFFIFVLIFCLTSKFLIKNCFLIKDLYRNNIIN